MTVPEFFELFLEELRTDKTLWYYYKFLSDPKKLEFRKAYFCQRLQYVMVHIGPKEQAIWDCGCGYGTTALFLAMNGYELHGSTLEFYFREIEKRKQYWKQFGNVDLFHPVYEDIYSSSYTGRFDTILVQDTLHHLEPIDDALKVLHRSLKNNGKLLVIEENGGNIIQNIKLIRQRGFNKVVETYDENLQRTVVFGDENIRSLSQWKKILNNEGFSIESDSVEHIRLLPPASFVSNYQKAIVRERKLVKQTLLRKYFYFGINFMAYKKDPAG